MDISQLSDAELMQLAGQSKSFTDKLGETWPARAAKAAWSGFTLPGDVMAGRAQLPSSGAVPGSVPFGDQASAGDRVVDLAGIATPMNPAVRAGDRVIPGAAKQPFTQAQAPVVPSTRELYDAGTADLNAVRETGLEVAPQAVSSFGERMARALYDSGIHPVDAPHTYAKLKDITDVPSGAVATTASNLQSLRQSLGNTAQNFNPQAAKDQLAASRVIAGLDDFVKTLDPSSVLAGNAPATARLWERGRGNYAAAQRSNDITGELDKGITGILERAELNAQVANSGRNVDNAIRQRLAATLKKEKDVSGLTSNEVLALEDAARGGGVRNAARTIGNWLGGGGGVGQTLLAALGAGGGAIAGNAPGAVAGAAVPLLAGSGARSIANSLAKRDLNKVDELLRKRSPLYEERSANPVMGPGSQASREALIRALLEQRQ
jgi:hypothetical protein